MKSEVIVSPTAAAVTAFPLLVLFPVRRGCGIAVLTPHNVQEGDAGVARVGCRGEVGSVRVRDIQVRVTVAASNPQHNPSAAECHCAA